MEIGELKWDKLESNLKTGSNDKNHILKEEEVKEFKKAAEDLLTGKREDYINFQRGEVQRNGESIWAAVNTAFKTHIEGRQCVIVELTYTTVEKDSQKAGSSEKETIAFDAMEENGIIALWRLTLASGNRNYKLHTDLIIDLNIYVAKGTVSECFSRVENRTNIPLASDAVAHAAQGKYVVTGNTEGIRGPDDKGDYNDKNGGPYKGGSVKKATMRETLTKEKVLSKRIIYDGEKTICPGAETTAMDKYGNRME